MNNTPHIAFFGTSFFSVEVLNALKDKGFLPTLIITVPDKPKGRKAILTPPATKIWAEKEKISVIQPKSIKGDDFLTLLKEKGDWDLFIIAAYGKIIPLSVLELPKHKTLNVHPSLLPEFRGAAPIETAVLLAKETGVTIMEVDAEMDHGPIVSQEKLTVSWPQDAEIASKLLANMGGEMLARIIPLWIDNKIKGIPQEESRATYTKKVETQDGEINLNDSPKENWKKYLAYRYAPGVFFFTTRNQKTIRVLITHASFENDQFKIERVKPEGKKEMGFDDFKRGERATS